jgi:membrane protease YdiL (CAAX protease family)
VPVANVALATREALGGRLDLVPAVLALASTCLYAWLMVRKAAQLLEREEVVLVIESPPLASDASAEGRERRALAFGALAVLVLYFAAGWLQGGGSIDRVTGILLTLWVVVLGLAVAYPLVTRQSFTTALGLRRPAVASLLLAVPMGAACAVVMAAYGRLQDELLPVPRALEEEFERLLSFEGVPSWLRFFVMAVSPGICEELLWRGSFQEDAGARGRPWRTAAITGLYFGLFHLSAYRFVPTAVVGAVLAGVRMRSGSIFPCMVFHTVFNAVAFFGLSRLARRDVVGITGGEAHWLFGPLAAAGAAAVAAACLWGMRTPRRP